jgi:acetylornithine/succinyldiaminopimelate/putrescine aminotransferase
MGGGMPIGAFISSKENMVALTNKPKLGHITTFGGHPVCCAAALASLEVIVEEKLAESADAKGQQFAAHLIGHVAVKAIRQAGLMLGVELKDKSKINSLMTAFQDNHLIVDQFLFNDAAFRIAPPLTISHEEIGIALEHISKSLSSLK